MARRFGTGLCQTSLWLLPFSCLLPFPTAGTLKPCQSRSQWAQFLLGFATSRPGSQTCLVKLIRKDSQPSPHTWHPCPVREHAGIHFHAHHEGAKSHHPGTSLAIQSMTYFLFFSFFLRKRIQCASYILHKAQVSLRVSFNYVCAWEVAHLDACVHALGGRRYWVP